MKHCNIDLKVGTCLRIHTSSVNYISCFVRKKLSPCSYLVYIGHGCWEGILDPDMNTLTPLGDSCGWMTREQRMRPTMFNIQVEVGNYQAGGL